MTSDERKARFFELMQRFNELGRLLPDPESFDASDAAVVAEVKVITAEMVATRAAIDAVLEAEHRARA